MRDKYSGIFGEPSLGGNSALPRRGAENRSESLHVNEQLQPLPDHGGAWAQPPEGGGGISDADPDTRAAVLLSMGFHASAQRHLGQGTDARSRTSKFLKRVERHSVASPSPPPERVVVEARPEGTPGDGNEPGADFELIGICEQVLQALRSRTRFSPQHLMFWPVLLEHIPTIMGQEFEGIVGQYPVADLRYAIISAGTRSPRGRLYIGRWANERRDFVFRTKPGEGLPSWVRIETNAGPRRAISTAFMDPDQWPQASTIACTEASSGHPADTLPLESAEGLDDDWGDWTADGLRTGTPSGIGVPTAASLAGGPAARPQAGPPPKTTFRTYRVPQPRRFQQVSRGGQWVAPHPPRAWPPPPPWPSASAGGKSGRAPFSVFSRVLPQPPPPPCRPSSSSAASSGTAGGYPERMAKGPSGPPVGAYMRSIQVPSSPRDRPNRGVAYKAQAPFPDGSYPADSPKAERKFGKAPWRQGAAPPRTTGLPFHFGEQASRSPRNSSKRRSTSWDYWA